MSFSAENPADVPFRACIFLGIIRREKKKVYIYIKKKKSRVLSLPPVLEGRKRDVPQNIISAENSWGWDKVRALVVGEGCTRSTWQFGSKRLKFSVPPAVRQGHGLGVLKPRLLRGQAPFVAAQMGLAGPGVVLWVLLKPGIPACRRHLRAPELPAASPAPRGSHPGLSASPYGMLQERG